MEVDTTAGKAGRAREVDGAACAKAPRKLWHTAVDPLRDCDSRMAIPRFARVTGPLFPSARLRIRLRKTWGQVGDADGWLASRLFDLQRPTQAVDDKTWADLELPALFRQIDTTVTRLGSQYLYRLLRTYDFDADSIARRCATYDALAADTELREGLQLALSGLQSDSAARIVEVIHGPPPLTLARPHLLYSWSLVCLATLVWVAVSAVGPWPIALILAVNFAALYMIMPRLNHAAESLVQARRLLSVAERLGSVRSQGSIEEVRALAQDRARHARLRKGLRWLALLSYDTVWGGLSIAANWLCLARLVAYQRAIHRFMRSRHEWASTFERVASIDAAIAVTSFLQRMPVHCRPTVTSDATIALVAGYHPLIARPKANSVALTRRSALITGSNLSGKTTFVKMIGINIMLGHTLGICLAASATLPRSGVMAQVRSGQSVESGKSHYAAEAEAIGEFVRRASRGECRVFIIDEPFSGTNTVERIAVTKAVLDAISAHAQVLATTHDIELQHLLSNAFDYFYFREDPDVEGFFDFQVRSGISTERNAIRVLQRMGFPAEIVSTALSLAGGAAGSEGAGTAPAPRSESASSMPTTGGEMTGQ